MNRLAFNLGTTFFGTASTNPLANSTNLNGVSSLVTLFLNIAFVLAGLVLLFFFILGGIGLMGSAGKSDPQAAEQAKKTLTSAVIGFVVVFASYWIVKLVGQLIGLPNII
jgi:hypothetical protein